MGIENGGYNPDEYRLEVEARNRNSERSLGDKILGKNKTTESDIIQEEAGFSPEDQLHAYSRTFAVADRLGEAKDRKVSEKVIAHEQAVVDNNEFDNNKAKAESKANYEKVISGTMVEAKENRLEEHEKWERALKAELEVAQKQVPTLIESIRLERESARMQPEKLQPAAYARVEKLEEQLRDARATISSREKLLSEDLPKVKANIEAQYGSGSE